MLKVCLQQKPIIINKISVPNIFLCSSIKSTIKLKDYCPKFKILQLFKQKYLKKRLKFKVESKFKRRRKHSKKMEDQM